MAEKRGPGVTALAQSGGLPAVASAKAGGIGSVIDFPAERGEPQEVPDGGPFQHNNEVDPQEPDAGAVDELSLPRIAFAEFGQDGNRTTWGYPHHFVKGATAKDEMGTVSNGTMYLHKGLLAKQLGHADMMHLESPARDHLEAHAKTIGAPLPDVNNFDAGDAAQAQRMESGDIALSTPQPGAKLRVDFDQGVIYGVTLMTQGRVRPAADGGVDDDARAADNVTLAQLCKGINATAEGVKCHVTHAFLEAIPGTLKDTLFTWVGRIRNARIEGDSAKGDVHLSRAAAVSPNGDLRTYLLTRADDDPKSLGLSAIFTPDRAASRRAGALRIAKVKSVDFVGEAGSTNDGLLSAPQRAAGSAGFSGAASKESGVVNVLGKESRMDPKLRAYLEKIGLKKEATEAEAEVCLAGLTGDQKAGADGVMAAIKAGKEPVLVALSAQPPPPAPAKPETPPAETPEQAIARDRQYRKDLIALAKEHGIQDESWATGLYERNVSLAHAREAAAAAKAMQTVPMAAVTRDGSRDKLMALCDGVSRAVRLRSGSKVEEPKKEDLVACQAAEVANRFKGLSTVEMFRRWGDGIGIPDAMYLSQADCADLMIGGSTLIRRRYGDTVAMAGAEGTSDFPALLLDAINKNMRQAYLDVPIKWPQFCKKNTARDFKNIYSIAMSEFPDLLPENEAAEVKDAALADTKETYKLGVFRRRASITWQAFINDDMSAFNRIPLMMATASRRKEDDVAFAPITSNQLMQDGFNLFDATHHKNVVSGTGAAVPSVTSLAAMRTLLKKQKGPLGAARLEISLGISLVPITLETLLEQVLHSTWDPEASAFERKNPFANKVEMVSNSRLDDASEDAWYGLALLSDSVVGMEIAFLESQEGPVLRQEVSFNTDDIRFAIRHCVAAHAIDWRAFVQNPGK